MANYFQYKDLTIRIGDTVKVAYRIKEKGKERIQDFVGIVLQSKGIGPNKMFTVRKLTRSGIGVERIFPLISPHIKEVTVVKKTNYRKASAEFVRNLSRKMVARKLYSNKSKQN